MSKKKKKYWVTLAWTTLHCPTTRSSGTWDFPTNLVIQAENFFGKEKPKGPGMSAGVWGVGESSLDQEAEAGALLKSLDCSKCTLKNDKSSLKYVKTFSNLFIRRVDKTLCFYVFNSLRYLCCCTFGNPGCEGYLPEHLCSLFRGTRGANWVKRIRL